MKIIRAAALTTDETASHVMALP